MSKATKTEIKDSLSSLKKRLVSLDRKVDLLTQEVDGIKEIVEKLDKRLWTFGGLIIAACVGALLKVIDL
jgi:chromosome segregation ATPase